MSQSSGGTKKVIVSEHTLWFHQLFSVSLQFHLSIWTAASDGLPCDSPSAAPVPSADYKTQTHTWNRNCVAHLRFVFTHQLNPERWVDLSGTYQITTITKLQLLHYTFHSGSSQQQNRTTYCSFSCKNSAYGKQGKLRGLWISSAKNDTFYQPPLFIHRKMSTDIPVTEFKPKMFCPSLNYLSTALLFKL